MIFESEPCSCLTCNSGVIIHKWEKLVKCPDCKSLLSCSAVLDMEKLRERNKREEAA